MPALNPAALMQTPMTLADHQASRIVADPLHLLDCCLMTDGAVVVLVTSAERARDLAKPPVRVAGMQGMRSGREEIHLRATWHGPEPAGLWPQAGAGHRTCRCMVWPM